MMGKSEEKQKKQKDEEEEVVVSRHRFELPTHTGKGNDVAYVAHAGAYKHPRSLPGIGVGESENSEDDESDVDEEVEES